MSYAQLIGELKGSFPRASALAFGKFLNTAWQEIQDLRLWSFNVVSNGQQFVPAIINAGTIDVTFGSRTIQVDAAAQAVLNVNQIGPPLLASPMIGQGRQLRLTTNTSLSPLGPIYSIIGYDDIAGVITIDRPYGEASATGAGFQVYKAYYAPPIAAGFASPTFVRYFSIVNPSSGYSIRGPRLYRTQAQLNAIDPQRGAQGDAYVLSYLAPNAVGQPTHEFYPHPTTQCTYIANYQIRWPTLSAEMDLPQMPYALEALVLTLAKKKAAEWAMANVGTYPELQNVNWVAFQQMQEKNFKDERIQCIKSDDEINPLLAVLQGSAFDFPLGGQFLQSHDISSLIPGN